MTNSDTVLIEIGAVTDVGRARELNEDTVFARLLAEDNSNPWRMAALLCVADGMGGHMAGEVASRRTGDEVLRQFASDTAKSLDYPEVTGQRLVTHLAETIQSINRKVHKEGSGTGTSRPGTTLTLCLMRPNEYCIGHVGDSRAYLVRNGATTQVTEDDSWVADAVRHGHLSEEEARRSPFRNQITKSIGLEPDVEPSVYHGSLQPGDVILLCTDGLTEYIEGWEIADFFQADTSVQETVQRLVALANARGGHDNISAAAARVPLDTSHLRKPETIPPMEIPESLRQLQAHPKSRQRRFRRPSRLGKWPAFLLLIATVSLVVGFWCGRQLGRGKVGPAAAPVNPSGVLRGR